MVPEHRAFLRDAAGVSPVVGTILMLAVTVMLAAALLFYVQGAVADLPLVPRWQADDDMHTTHTPPTSDDGDGSPPPGQPPSREEKWSVEPLPGYTCEYRMVGPADFLCVREVA